MKKVKKGVESNSMDFLSKTQKEILDMLTRDFLTVKKIASLRGVTEQAVYKIYKKLRKKGYITRGFNRGLKKSRGVTPQKVEKVRLHGQQFYLKIIWKGSLYEKIRHQKNIHFYEDHTIQLFEKGIIVSCNSFHFFYGKDASMTAAKSFEYWQKIFLDLQEKYNIELLGKKAKIKQLNAHYSVWDEKLGKYVEENGEKIEVYTTDDKKLWFKLDKSWGDHERECVHPQTAQTDQDNVVEPFFNDIRDNQWIKLSDISKYMANTTYQINELAHGLKSIVDFLKLNLPKEEERKEDRKQSKIPNYIN